MVFVFSAVYVLWEIVTGRSDPLATMTTGKIRIGTRGSPLALAQAHETRARLLAAHADLVPETIEIVSLSTRGDRIIDRSLSELGGKGLFTEEIEGALLRGGLDMAVHSMKDMPTVLPDGLEIKCFLPREDVHDAFICNSATVLADLPEGALVGTASLRRQAQILRLRPDLRVEAFRGNVQTRLRKLDEGLADATILAMAGLRRLDLADIPASIFSIDDMMPAVSQGAIGIETRVGDERISSMLAPINDSDTAICVGAERSLLLTLDGSCRMPIGGYACLTDKGSLHLRAEILSPDGSQHFFTERSGAAENAASLGGAAGGALRAAAGAEFFAALENA